MRLSVLTGLAGCASGAAGPLDAAHETAVDGSDSAPDEPVPDTGPSDSGDETGGGETGEDWETGEPVSVDADGDGQGSIATGGTDCDDLDPRTFLGAEERCDYADRDCDGDPYAPGVCSYPSAPADVAWAVWNGPGDYGASPLFGGSVAIAGDLDLDGDREPFVNCWGCDSLCEPGWAHGGVYLLDNPSHVQMPKRYDEALLAGWVGDCTFEEQGEVVNPGDVDGDGYDDLAFTGTEAYYSVGWLAIRYGPWDATWPARGAVDESTDGWWWSGFGADSHWGEDLAGPGDLDGDGKAELVVSLAGGMDGERPVDAALYRFPGDDWRGQREDRADAFLAATSGYTGTPLLHTAIYDVASAGDLDGDGVSELLVAREDPAAEVPYFVSLVDGAALSSDVSEISDLALADLETSPHGSSNCLTGLGDMDGDGYGEVAIGDQLVDNPSGRAKGNRAGIHVINGRGSGWVSAPIADVAEGLWLDTNAAWLNSLLDCAGRGDFDGDLTSDFVLGGRRQEGYGADRSSPNTTTETYLFVIPGRDGPPVGTVDFGSVSLPIASTSLDTEAGESSTLGVSVALGDLTGDGLDDALVGDDAVNGLVGAVYVFPGWEIPWDAVRDGR